MYFISEINITLSFWQAGFSGGMLHARNFAIIIVTFDNYILYIIDVLWLPMFFIELLRKWQFNFINLIYNLFSWKTNYGYSQLSRRAYRLVKIDWRQNDRCITLMCVFAFALYFDISVKPELANYLDYSFK